jgi:hypothetical protein
MTNDIERFKAQIRYRLINLRESVLNLRNGRIDLKISLSDEDYRFLRREAGKNNISRAELIKLIEEEREGIKLNPEITFYFRIIPLEIPLGQHIRLVTSDESGEAIEELICLGDNYFILIHHERNSLHLTDILRSITSPWNTGASVTFEVFRNNSRVILNNRLSLYRTRPLKQIAFLIPQIDYDKLVLNWEEYNNL